MEHVFMCESFHGNTEFHKQNGCLTFQYYSRVAKKIMDVMKDTEVVTHDDYTTMSRNYKMGVANEYMKATVQGNVLFDPTSQLPREVLLETTLKAFGFSMDIWEVCCTINHNNQSLLLRIRKQIFLLTVEKYFHWCQ